jgi:hypothetical protein
MDILLAHNRCRQPSGKDSILTIELFLLQHGYLVMEFFEDYRHVGVLTLYKRDSHG